MQKQSRDVVFVQTRSAIGKKVKKIAENILSDGERVLKIVVLAGRGKIAYVTKELVRYNDQPQWRNLGVYLP